MMKTLILSLTLFLLLSLSAAASDIMIKWLQNYHLSSDRVLTIWGSLDVEDIEILALYNDSRVIVFKQSWSHGNLSDIDWMFYGMFLSSFIYYAEIHIDELSRIMECKGVLITQFLITCPSSTDNPAGYSFKVAWDGEDLVHLDVTQGVWVAGNHPHSQDVQKFLQEDEVTLISINKTLRNQCHSLATTYAAAGKEAFSRKMQPQVYITRKPDQYETYIFCMVTGFYPKPINVSLWKENTMEDVMSTDTLPNGDATYQITVLATTNLIEEQSVYCRVEHSSLKEPLIVYLDTKNHISSSVIVYIILAIASVVGLACVIKYYRSHRRYVSIAGTAMERLSLRTRDRSVSNT